MRIRKYTSKDSDNATKMIKLDENGEFIEIEERSYEIYLTSSEYRKIIPDILEEHIAKAIIRKINAYFAYSNASKFILCGLDISSAQEPVVVFSTSDEDKFELLDNIAKKFVEAVIEANKEKDE